MIILFFHATKPKPDVSVDAEHFKLSFAVEAIAKEVAKGFKYRVSPSLQYEEVGGLIALWRG